MRQMAFNTIKQNIGNLVTMLIGNEKSEFCDVARKIQAFCVV